MYIADWKFCHQIKAPCHIPYGLIMPLTPPSTCSEKLGMDLISDVWKSTALGCSGILVIVDLLTNMAIYLTCRGTIDSPVPHIWLLNIWSGNLLAQTILTPIAAKWLPVISGMWFTPTLVSITESHSFFTNRQIVTLDPGITWWCSTSETFTTTGRITRIMYLHWWILGTITPLTTQHWWCCSGGTMTTILKCNSTHPRLPVAHHRFRQSSG